MNCFIYSFKSKLILNIKSLNEDLKYWNDSENLSVVSILYATFKPYRLFAFIDS